LRDIATQAIASHKYQKHILEIYAPMGGNSQQQQTYSTGVQQQSPWAEQIPYLTQMFGDAQSLYNRETAAPVYSGDQVAQTPQAGRDAFGNALNFTNGTGQQGSTAAINAGLGLFGTGGNATNTAANGLANFASNDPTQHNISTANQYANDPYISGQVDAAMQDANRQYSENTVPGIDRNAVANGNAFSTRTGIAQGIAERGLQEQAANTSAALRGSAWNSGLTAAQQGQTNQLNAYNALGSVGNTANSNAINAVNGGYSDNVNNLNAATTATNGLANAQQNNINNQIAMSQFPFQLDQNYLNNEYSLIGNRSWGGTTQSNNLSQGYTQTNPSPMSTAGSVMGGVGSLMKCDIRVKENIKRIGTFNNGLPLYSFNYVGCDHTQIGPMAQEVETVTPQAVIEIEGIKFIDLNSFVESQV
jgi:hypothetical protein